MAATQIEAHMMHDIMAITPINPLYLEKSPEMAASMNTALAPIHTKKNINQTDISNRDAVPISFLHIITYTRTDTKITNIKVE